MTQKGVIRKALEMMQAKLGAFDFKLNIAEQGFWREDGDVTYFFFFLIYNEVYVNSGQKGFQLVPYAKTHLAPVEKYYKQITVNTYLKTKWDFITIGNSIADLIANPDGINRKRNQSLDLYVFDEAHIGPVVNEMINKFKEVALPYFLTNNTVKRIDELLNEYPTKYSVHMYNDLFRFVKGIIAAKLNNNPDVDRLLAIYNSLIIERDMPENCKIEMARLEEMLPTIK